MKIRRGTHTTLTETAAIVVKELRKLTSIKLIAPGEIKTTRKRTTGKRHLTIIETAAGLRLIITGTGTQYVAVHTDYPEIVVNHLKTTKQLVSFTIKTRSPLAFGKLDT